MVHQWGEELFPFLQNIHRYEQIQHVRWQIHIDLFYNFQIYAEGYCFLFQKARNEKLTREKETVLQPAIRLLLTHVVLFPLCYYCCCRATVQWNTSDIIRSLLNLYILCTRSFIIVLQFLLTSETPFTAQHHYSVYSHTLYSNIHRDVLLVFTVVYKLGLLDSTHRQRANDAVLWADQQRAF